MSISDTESDDIPIFMTRLVADSGASIIGGPAQVGRVAETADMRSATTWRACIRSLPGLKISWIDETWGADFERRMSRPSTPLSACSSGTVTSDSTSSADIPRAGVWISTLGGANSGKTSTGSCRSWAPPKNIIPIASAMTR